MRTWCNLKLIPRASYCDALRELVVGLMTTSSLTLTGFTNPMSILLPGCAWNRQRILYCGAVVVRV